MTNETQAQAAANAPAKVADTVAATTKAVVAESKQAAKRERAAGKRRAKRAAAPKAATIKTSRTTARRSKAQAKRSAGRPAAAARNERIETVTYDFNNLFAGIPAVAPFQNLFNQAGDRGQEAARRSQQVAQDLAELTRANVEALVDAGRIAAEGARALGRETVASTRDGVEKAAEAVRTFAEAKSPTELLQLQSDYARSSFDRLVAQSSKLTESMVKLAGEAFQPLSNRASVTAERVNQFVA